MESCKENRKIKLTHNQISLLGLVKNVINMEKINVYGQTISFLFNDLSLFEN